MNHTQIRATVTLEQADDPTPHAGTRVVRVSGPSTVATSEATTLDARGDGDQMSKHTGRSTRRYRALKAQFRAWCRNRTEPCWLCSQPIDYNLPPDDPMSFSIDHYHPKADRPDLAEDITNFRASHLDCNKRRGRGRAPTALGTRSANW